MITPNRIHRMLRISITAFIFLMAVFLGRAESQQASATLNLPDILSALTPPGWEIYGKVKQFNADTLYQQINGRAELFIAYDMSGMTFVSYANKSNPQQFIDISIYDMSNPTNAFGVFSSERLPKQPSLHLGRDSYRTDSSYFIWKGRYYIRIIASEITKATETIGFHTAEKLTNTLTDTGEPIWGLTALPKKDLVPASTQYFKVNAMGLDFMMNTYTALYIKENKEVMMFLSQQDSVESVRKIANLYMAYAKDFGKGVERLKIGDMELYLCNMEDSYDIFFKKDRLIGGVSWIEDRDFAVRVATELWQSLIVLKSSSFRLLRHGCPQLALHLPFSWVDVYNNYLRI